MARCWPHFPAVAHDARFEPNGPLGQQIVAHPQAGLITVKSPADGLERRLGYQRLAEYPIYVSAGFETSAIRARWLATMSQHLIFGAPATALLFFLLSLALRRTQHLYAEAAKRTDAEEALKHGQRLEALGQLTGGVAHDFNNLLTVIRASVDMLRRPDLPEPRRQRYIEAISDTVTRAAKLTAQLLAFARRQTLKPELFDVAQSVQMLGEMIATLIGSRIEIVLHMPDQPCFINADVGQFETAMINMAVNARDAIEGPGRLTIAVRVVADLPGAAAASHKSARLSSRCRSRTPASESPRSSARIFEPFFTTKGSARAPGSACRRCSASPSSPGAKSSSHSELGKGASSRCICRASRAANGSRRSWRKMRRRSMARACGCLWSRTMPMSESSRPDALTGLGYSATLVGSDTHALEELVSDAGRFDVVFSDVVMPGMSGIELAQEIRRRHPDLPVVLTSGYSHVLSQNGSYGFELLQKPYSIEQLAAVLQKVGRWRKVKRGTAPASS